MHRRKYCLIFKDENERRDQVHDKSRRTESVDCVMKKDLLSRVILKVTQECKNILKMHPCLYSKMMKICLMPWLLLWQNLMIKKPKTGNPF